MGDDKDGPIGKPKPREGQVGACPKCGLQFQEPLDANVKNWCPEPPLGCGQSFTVVVH